MQSPAAVMTLNSWSPADFDARRMARTSRVRTLMSLIAIFASAQSQRSERRSQRLLDFDCQQFLTSRSPRWPPARGRDSGRYRSGGFQTP